MARPALYKESVRVHGRALAIIARDERRVAALQQQNKLLLEENKKLKDKLEVLEASACFFEDGEWWFLCQIYIWILSCDIYVKKICTLQCINYISNSLGWSALHTMTLPLPCDVKKFLSNTLKCRLT